MAHPCSSELEVEIETNPSIFISVNQFKCTEFKGENVLFLFEHAISLCFMLLLHSVFAKRFLLLIKGFPFGADNGPALE